MNPNKIKLEKAIRERAKLLREMNVAESKINRMEIAKNKLIDEAQQRLRKEVSTIKTNHVKDISNVKNEQKQIQKSLRVLGMDILKIEHDIRQDKK